MIWVFDITFFHRILLLGELVDGTPLVYFPFALVVMQGSHKANPAGSTPSHVKSLIVSKHPPLAPTGPAGPDQGRMHGVVESGYSAAGILES